MGSFPYAKAVGVLVLILIAILALVLARAAQTREHRRATFGGADRAWWTRPAPRASRKALVAYIGRQAAGRPGGDNVAKTLEACMRGGTGAGLERLRAALIVAGFARASAGGSSARAKRRAREVLNLLPAGASGPYLDWGCGDGSVTAAVGARLGAATGVDPDPSAGSKCGPACRVLRPTETGKLPPGSFGVATALMSLHHVDDPKGTADELARLLRQGGVLVVREHDLGGCPPPLAKNRAAARGFLDWLHVVYDLSEGAPVEELHLAHYRGRREWKALLEGAGFRLESSTKTRGSVCGYFGVFTKTSK